MLCDYLLKNRKRTARFTAIMIKGDKAVPVIVDLELFEKPIKGKCNVIVEKMSLEDVYMERRRAAPA